MAENLNDKILIVDDNQQNLALMVKALKNEKIEIHTAKSGALAFDKLHNCQFSLIIVDVHMPILTGFDTVKIIQESQLSQNTPIIFISSQYKAEADIDKGFAIGAYDYILRPIDLTLFRNKVKTFLQLSRTEQELKLANQLLAEKTIILDQKLKKQIEINTELQFSEQVFEKSVNGIIIVDENLRFIRVNKAFTEITGYSHQELIGKTPKILSSGVQGKLFYEEMWKVLKDKGAWQGELWNKKKGNELYAEMLSINAVKDEHGVVSNYIGIVSDITEKKLANEEAEYLAHYDYLTGLPNRLHLMHTLKKYLSDENIKFLAVMFLDLDKFKPINDLYGHQFGDELLVAVAKRLKGCIRETDLATRLGGDEFIVILNQSSPALEASKKVASKIIQALSSTFHISGKEVTINTSVGIALYPEHGKDADSLITLADNAMYKSKEQGAGHFNF
ncbi:MAG: diguanylate cyclase [Methyloprofundus sp.]|nr:diguanylate cyclase [Methyloprofundus sp.]